MATSNHEERIWSQKHLDAKSTRTQDLQYVEAEWFESATHRI